MVKSYFIKERTMAIGTKFDVLDELSNNIFVIEADKPDIDKNISIYSANKDKLLLYIGQKLRIGNHKYQIYDYQKNEITIVQKNFINNRYNIDGKHIKITMEATSLFGRSYNVIKDDTNIGSFNKELNIMSKYRYKLDVFDDNFTLLLVGLLVIINVVKFDKKIYK